MSLQKMAVNAKSRRQLWFERFMAILALVDLGFVVFDLSYIRLRNFYLQNIPALPQLYDPDQNVDIEKSNRVWLPGQRGLLNQLYDPVKDIEPYEDTQNYLKTVEELDAQIVKTGLQSPETEALLTKLRQESEQMIRTNPFALANKTGTLEKIKDRMRQHVGNSSATQSFNTFWSQPYLSQKGWNKEIAFYNQKIAPLMATNFFRHYSEAGDFVDNFWWMIDIWLIITFGLEFLARTYVLSRRHKGITWLDAMLWRWYDIFLLVPFDLILVPFLGLLRLIPVLIRLDQAQLLSLERVQDQINRAFVANIAEDMTEVIVIRVLDQVQSAIRQGELVRLLSQREPRRAYININNVNEVEAISQLLVNLSVYQVLPKILPDLEAILQHNIEKILNQSPVYRGLQQVPGLAELPSQLTERLAKEVTQGAYKNITNTLENPDLTGDELVKNLVQNLSKALGSELQAKQTIEQIQSLLLEMLEEIKLNYVQRLSEADFEQILEQTRAIRSQVVKR